MKNKNYINVISFIICAALFCNLLTLPAMFSKSYCKEAEQAGKEMNELHKKSERLSEKNPKLSSPFLSSRTEIESNFLFITAEKIAHFSNIFFTYVISKEFSRRAPPHHSITS